MLCLREGILGGLADYVEPADRIVFPADGTVLNKALTPLASANDTTGQIVEPPDPARSASLRADSPAITPEAMALFACGWLEAALAADQAKWRRRDPVPKPRRSISILGLLNRSA